MALVISSGRTTTMTSAGTLNNPFISFENLFSSSVATKTTEGGTEQTDGAALNASTGTTYDYWSAVRSGTSVSWRCVFGTNRRLRFAGVAGHNLADLGATIALQYSTNSGSSWSDCGAGSVTPSDNSNIGFYFDNTDADYWRFRVTNLTTDDPVNIAVLWGGITMTVERRVYQGFEPVLSPTEVDLQSNVSEGGNLLGSTVVRRGSTLNFAPQNLEPSFARGDDMLDFIPSFNSGNPFWFAWRPTKYLTDLHYCWRDGGTLRPVNSGPRDLMSFDLSARVFEA